MVSIRLITFSASATTWPKIRRAWRRCDRFVPSEVPIRADCDSRAKVGGREPAAVCSALKLGGRAVDKGADDARTRPGEHIYTLFWVCFLPFRPGLWTGIIEMAGLLRLSDHDMTPERGFLCTYDAADVTLPSDLAAAEQAAKDLPRTLLTGRVRKHLEALPVLDLGAFCAGASEPELRSAMVRYS